jgi:hypothetical protein
MGVITMRDATKDFQAKLEEHATEDEMALVTFMADHDEKNPVVFTFRGVTGMIHWDDDAILSTTMAIIARHHQ